MAVIRQQSPVIGLLLRFFISAAALGVATWLVPGIRAGGVGPLLAAAAIFGVVNAVIKPIISVLTCPLVVLTLGLFIFVINGLLFWSVGSFVDGFHVDGFWSAVFGAIVYSVISWLLSMLLPRKHSQPPDLSRRLPR